jgi:hypothetical protein
MFLNFLIVQNKIIAPQKKRKTLSVMVFALHKFGHYLLGNKLNFYFYVNQNILVYFVNKPQVSQGK